MAVPENRIHGSMDGLSNRSIHPSKSNTKREKKEYNSGSTGRIRQGTIVIGQEVQCSDDQLS